MLLRNVCIINNLQSVNLALSGSLALVSGFICLDVIADIEIDALSIGIGIVSSDDVAIVNGHRCFVCSKNVVGTNLKTPLFPVFNNGGI